MSSRDVMELFIESGGEKKRKPKPKKKPLPRRSANQQEREEHLALVKECFLRARPMCWTCGRMPGGGWVLDLDHVQPRARGGSDEPTNLQLLCRHPALHQGCHVDKTGAPGWSKQ